jgi:TRAP-type C4-dicarboxylate transport system permease small subunit
MTGHGPAPDRNDGLTDLARQVDEASRKADFIDWDRGLPRFERAVNAAAEAAGVAVLATIVGLVFVNAVGRYAFSFTFIWGDELVLSLLPWLGMLGMFLSIRRRQIIRIDFFAAQLPRLLHRTLELGASLFAAAVFLWLAIVSLEYMQFFGGDRTIYLQLRKGWFMSALAIGPALAALAYLYLAWRDLRDGGSRAT